MGGLIPPTDAGNRQMVVASFADGLGLEETVTTVLYGILHPSTDTAHVLHFQLTSCCRICCVPTRHFNLAYIGVCTYNDLRQYASRVYSIPYRYSALFLTE
jgi:hypothetical protein